MRICDDSGCSERSTQETNTEYKPVEAKSEEMIALEKLAAKEPKAAYDLALRLFRGDGVKQDSYESLQWMRKAAERGSLDAQKALGRLYLTGLEEMGSDPAEAEKWLMIAAGRGDKESEELLAEASAAKKNEQNYYQWRTRWRNVFYGYWYRGYRYLGYWRSGYWYYY
ncbi:tetratricopeptide repeat protein [Halioxenophilus aromaticivorans]|uniref:Tetratricopeptide repeat protein n=2 Tax=Halioxenophilus aromaticivorans TaxID=1306992 RepID=A0AAV3TZL1_9ALTE